MTDTPSELHISSQRTLKAPIHCQGVGLHSGKTVSMTLRPAEVNSGIVFVRTDAAVGQRIIPARWNRVVDTTLCTVIGNEHGVAVGTVEHLMAALRGSGIDNLTIELDGPEVPIMDGSAAPFVFLIECAGIVSQAGLRRAIRILRPIEVRDGDRMVRLSPGVGSEWSFEIDFPGRGIGRQVGSVRLVDGTFKSDLARARTFGFLSDVEMMRSRGLALGGSLDNAIVIGTDGVMNPEGLRYEDEFVRHKILDAIGDIYLAGAPIVGTYEGVKAGHRMNNLALSALFGNDAAWCYDTGAVGDSASRSGWRAGELALSA